MSSTTTTLPKPLSHYDPTIWKDNTRSPEIPPDQESSIWNNASFYLRVWTGGAIIGIGSLLGICIASVFYALGWQQQAGWATAPFVRLPFQFLLGTRFEVVEGSEYLNGVRPAVLVCNHQTDLDMIVMQTIWPRYCSTVAKKQTLWRPFLGFFVKLCGGIFVDRNNTAKDIMTLDDASLFMQEKRQSAFFFVEGTRGRPTKPVMLPLKKGAFHLAMKAKVPIVPVVTEVYDHIYSRQGKRFNRGVIRIKVLPAVETHHHSASKVDDLVSKVRTSMLKTLEDLYEDREHHKRS